MVNELGKEETKALFRAKELEELAYGDGINIETSAVVSSLLKFKEYGNLKSSSTTTYRKRYGAFIKAFPVLPVELDPILDYLSRFQGETGRYRRNQHDLTNALYDHAVHHFGLQKNPLDGVPRPKVRKKSIQTLSLEEVEVLDRTPEDDTERACWELLIGHGWRGIETRRLSAGDVRKARDNVIFIRGKERDEDGPILTETLALLNNLTPKSLGDDEPIIRSRRIRNRSSQPLGETGLSQLVGRLFERSAVERLTPHDLRRSFATLVQQASGGNDALAMRLIRDKVPDLNNSYINAGMMDLLKALDRYSPLHLISRGNGEFDSPPSPHRIG